MNTLVRKELQLILPAWLMATVLAVVPVWFFSAPDLVGWQEDGAAVAFYAFAFGAVFLGLSPFGQECALGTFSGLLAQPVSRRQVWRTKVSAVVVALLVAWVALVISYGIRIQAVPSRHVLAIGTVIALVALAGGLWTTLLFRQVAAALWFTLLVPPVILIATTRLWKNCSENVAFIGLATELLIYAVAGVAVARRLFFRAEDTSWTGGTVTLPVRWRFGAGTRSGAWPVARGPIRALWRKELQSHQLALLLAGGMLVLHLLVILVRRLEFDPTDPHNLLHSLLEFWWVQWLGLPFLVGSAAVAEERKLGTLEPQLCLPTTRRIQFAIKSAVALALGVLLGGVMPWLAEGITGLEVAPGTFHNARDIALGQPFMLTCLVSGAITVVSFYASTLMRNLLQAMAVAVAVGLGLNAFGAWAVAEAFGAFNSPHLWVGPLVVYIGLPTLLAVLLWLAFRNFKHVYVGSGVWRQNLFAVLGAMAFTVVMTTLIYNRAWEYFMTLEPKHGPARLSGAVTPRMCFAATSMSDQHLFDGREVVGGRPFVLLPDGRLWVANQYRVEPTGQLVSSRGQRNRVARVEEIYRAVPAGGMFLDRSNWVDLASSCMHGFGFPDHVVGVRSDGTLWNIFAASPRNGQANFYDMPKPERIGDDSDWKTVDAGWNYFLALKQDGSLWGWGGNESGQLGREPKLDLNGRASSLAQNVISQPVRIGSDSNWAAVFPARGHVTGIKRDGSVWKWGHLSVRPPGYTERWVTGLHAKPVRWSIEGSHWRAVNGMRREELILKQDGTIWQRGEVWGGAPGAFGHRLFQDYEVHFVETPQRLGTDSDWVDISRGVELVGLKRNGAIFQSAGWGIPLAAFGSVWQPSKYSDWIAIASHGADWPLTLAADGTLCAWNDPGQAAYANLTPDASPSFLSLRVLGPSRSPLWSVNILADAK